MHGYTVYQTSMFLYFSLKKHHIIFVVGLRISPCGLHRSHKERKCHTDDEEPHPGLATSVTRNYCSTLQHQHQHHNYKDQNCNHNHNQITIISWLVV